MGLVRGQLAERFDAEVPRYANYPTVPPWSACFGAKSYAEALERTGQPLALYVHLPFCRSQCAYCCGHMVLRHGAHQVDAYLAALEAELDLVAGYLGARRGLVQVHWGGGTPTALDDAQLERLWRAIQGRFDVAPSAEVTIEIAPATVQRSQLELLRGLGFNRLSIGVQDLDPTILSIIGRRQGQTTLEELLDQVRALGYRGVNVDLIYGLPQQTTLSWAETLQRLIAMRPDRAAIHAFAHLPELKANQRRLPTDDLPRGSRKLQLFKMAYEAFEAGGYRPIGTDHFARADDKLAVAQRQRTLRRNFQGYSAAPASDVVAIGLSAISEIGAVYAQNARELRAYQDALRAGRLATERGFALSAEDQRRKAVIQDLMCNFWADLGADAERTFPAELQRMRLLEREGLVTLAGREVAATNRGKLFIRNVARVFDAYPHAVEPQFWAL